MGYKHFGIHIKDDNSVVAQEWAPAAKEVFLTGDFSKIILLFVIVLV
jgi:1,4-alpha-glucan branching enzyme